MNERTIYYLLAFVAVTTIAIASLTWNVTTQRDELRTMYTSLTLLHEDMEDLQFRVNAMENRDEEPTVNITIKIMLARNALAGWRFECPGPEIPYPGGGHTHRPCWVKKSNNDAMEFESQMARGIVFPSEP